jgi:hypothetical protein
MDVKRASHNSSDPAKTVTQSCPIEQKAIVAIAGLTRATCSRFYGETQLDAVKTAASVPNFALRELSREQVGRIETRKLARS